MKAILVSIEPDLGELRSLSETLGCTIVSEFVQRRKRLDPRFYIGKGKLEELSDYVRNNEIELAIFNTELKPPQVFALEKKLGIQIYDRVRLILEIFLLRAHSKEAKLQVELAKLQYETHIAREYIHRTKTGEHPGLFFAGGGYQVEQYYETILNRTKKIKSELERISQQRAVRRKHRRRHGFYLISITGYTNSGKSTLLNALTSGNVTIDDKLFSTLSPTIRRLLGVHRDILLIDTVGFIRNLPHWIIEAFKATLEEIVFSDVILLLVDVSDTIDEISEKLKTSLEVLWSIETISPVIIVFNKIDLVTRDGLKRKINELRSRKILSTDNYVSISAQKREELESLMKKIHQLLPPLIRYQITLRCTERVLGFVNWLYEHTYVIEPPKTVFHSRNRMNILVECESRLAEDLQRRVKGLRGRVREVKQR